MTRKTRSMNQDEGSYQLSHMWDKLLLTDVKLKKCSHLYAYHSAQLLYTRQHRTVLIILPLLQTNIIAQMLSVGQEWGKRSRNVLLTILTALPTTTNYFTHIPEHTILNAHSTAYLDCELVAGVVIFQFDASQTECSCIHVPRATMHKTYSA